jgi:hypothetical protein
MLPARVQVRICAERRRSGHASRAIAARLGYAHATVWKALRREGATVTGFVERALAALAGHGTEPRGLMSDTASWRRLEASLRTVRHCRARQRTPAEPFASYSPVST